VKRLSSGSPWEAKIGYSRAVVANGFVFVSATAATDAEGRIVGKGDVYTQVKTILAKFAPVLAEAGSGFEHVVQTRIYVTDISEWEAVGRAHAEVFGAARPALSLVHVKPFLDPDMLVEIEIVSVVAN